LQALNALMTFRTGRTRIAFGAALADRSSWTNTCGTCRTDGTWWTERTWRTGWSMQTGGASLGEQLARNRTCVDGTALLDRGDSLLGRSDARVELRRVHLLRRTRDKRHQREPLHV
jgi:hypothetical protein